VSIFRAYDIRGIVGDNLTPEIVTQIGQAIGSEAALKNQKTIAVGRDGRLSGAELLQALIKGLRMTGRDVIDIGMIPTPVLYFATYHLNIGSGVMLTGSHNPANYNGMKTMLAGDTLSGDAIQTIKRRVEQQDFVTGQGSLQTQDVQRDYIQRIVQDVKLHRPFKVVIDCGNGAAGQLAPQLLKTLGCEVIELFCEIDGNFPNHHPDPTVLKNLQDLIKTVKQTGADLGLGFDGDGDRLGVVDANGTVIWPDRQMILYATDILNRHPNAAIVYDVKCSRHLGKSIAEHGGKPVMWRTGHSLIKSKIKQEQALLGGEMSGHIFFKERWYGFDDALYTAARLLEILAKDHRSPSEVFSSLPDAVSTAELKLEVAKEGEHFELMQKVLDNFKFADAEIITIDGLRADFADGWGLVRASNTTPCLVIRFEAETEAALARIQQDFRQQFLAIDSHLQLPF
jgi:phosphomannomutase/phosphoglucomutase